MAYRLLAADYDLTLTRSDRAVAEPVRRAIREAFDRGGLVTLATGRLSDGARQAKGLFPAEVPLSLCNGAILQSSASGEILREVILPPDTAARALAVCARYAGATMIWCREGLFADRINEASDIYARITGTPVEPMPRDRDILRNGVHKLLLLAEPASVLSAARDLEAMAEELSFFPSSPEVLEMVAKGVDKSAGLAAAAELLGFRQEETAALGDGENDIPMLRWAGLGCAMENAPDKVKAAADLIAPHCDRDGAVWFMERVFPKR